jgi:hypothetical protein
MTAKLAGLTERVVQSWEKGDDVSHHLAGKYSNNEDLEDAGRRIASVYVGMIVMLSRGMDLPDTSRDPAIYAGMQRLAERFGALGWPPESPHTTG